MKKLSYKVENTYWLAEPPVTMVPIPPSLLCPICLDLVSEAVMMPCCAGSACDQCARQGILDSEGSKCPVCSDVANPEELIPYRLFRDKVDRFCSQTGYSKATTIPHTMSPVSAKTTLPDIVLPDLTDDSLNFDMPGGQGASTQVRIEPPNLNLSSNPSSYVLAPNSYYPPPPPRLAPAPALYHHPTTKINPSVDPLAAFEEETRKLDSKKASRRKLKQQSPPRAYRLERPRSREREYRDMECSPRRRSPRGYSSRKRMSPSTVDRTGSGSKTLPPSGELKPSLSREGMTSSPGMDYRGEIFRSRGPRQKERYVTDIHPETEETEEERRERERFERELAEMEREDQYINHNRVESSKGRVAPTPHREFIEREKEIEFKRVSSIDRTPSLSPEPATHKNKYIGRYVKNEFKENVSIQEVRVKYSIENANTSRDNEYFIRMINPKLMIGDRSRDRNVNSSSEDLKQTVSRQEEEKAWSGDGVTDRFKGQADERSNENNVLTDSKEESRLVRSGDSFNELPEVKDSKRIEETDLV